MRTSHLSVLLLLTAASAASVYAQSQYLPSQRIREIRVDVGERAFAGLSISYARAFPAALYGKGLYLQGGVEIPVLLDIVTPQFNDFAAFAEGGTRFLLGKRLGLGAAGRLFLDRQDYVLGKNTAWGFALNGTPFVRLGPCMLGIDLGWRQVVATYIQHSDYVKATFEDRYPGNTGPRDGWYFAPATRLSTGLAVGGIVGNRVTLDLVAGVKFTPSPYVGFMDGMMFGQIPYCGRIGFGIFM